MSHKRIEMDGFVRDENGKWHALPMKLNNPEIDENSSSKKKQVRKYIPIEPLKISPPVDSPEKKRAKIEKPVRKELFKRPQRKINTRLFFNTRESNVRLSTKPKTTKYKFTARKTNHQLHDGSPLLDINEAEKLLQANSLSLQPLGIPSIVITPPKKELAENTSKSNESINEFLQFENQLATLNETESPMSSFCTLLENVEIDNSKDTTAIFKKIGNIIEEDNETLNDVKQRFLNYYQEHERKYNQIKDLLSQLNSESDKENKKRRSSRIASQVTITQKKTKFVISPAISEEVDLRRSTLRKNLTRNLQTEAQTPRTKKAVDLYNTMRTDYGVLCTPKLDRKAMENEQASVRKSLSRRVQKQCLLLQDTPQ